MSVFAFHAEGRADVQFTIQLPHTHLRFGVMYNMRHGSLPYSTSFLGFKHKCMQLAANSCLD